MNVKIDPSGTMTVTPYNHGEHFALSCWVDKWRAGKVVMAVEYDSPDDGEQRLVVQSNNATER